MTQSKEGFSAEEMQSFSEETMAERKACPMRHPVNGNCLPAGGFCSAVNDEICAALHSAYDMGGCDLYRKIRMQGKDTK